MNSVSIDIAGISYKIRTDDEPDYVRGLASLVTAKILEIKRDTGASAVDCAQMAALDFADRWMKETQKKKPAPRKKSLPEGESAPAL
jgi:cell division protein ZapA (FtsZ GTPase activity inhibitor)